MNWIDEVVRQAKELHESQRQQDELHGRNELIKEDLFAQFWKQLHSGLLQAGEDFNTKYGSEAVRVMADDAGAGTQRIAVTAQMTSKVSEHTVTLTRSGSTINWRAPDASQHYGNYYEEILNFEVEGSGSDQKIVCCAWNRRMGPDDLVERVMKVAILAK